MIKREKILISGGLGMIGSAIAKELVKMGKIVTIVDAKIKGYGANIFNIKGFKDKVRLIEGDIRDKELMADLIKEHHIFFNLAAQVSHNSSMVDPINDAQINYMAHLQILDLAKKYNPEILLVHAGSRLQYGKVDKIPVKESFPLKPLTPYALNKNSAERAYDFYSRLYNIPVLMLRISNPYGPGAQMKHSHYCIVNWFIKEALLGNEITIFGNGEQVRDYIYIDDLAYAATKLAFNESSYGEVFNMASGVPCKFVNMVNTIKEILPKTKVKFIPWPKNYVNVETGDFVADIDKLKKYVNFNVSLLKEGIHKSVKYYQKYKEHYLRKSNVKKCFKNFKEYVKGFKRCENFKSL